MAQKKVGKLLRGLRKSFAYGILGLWTLFLVYSFSWVLASSVSTTREIFTGELLASGIHLDNYVRVLTTNNLALYFWELQGIWLLLNLNLRIE